MKTHIPKGTTTPPRITIYFRTEEEKIAAAGRLMTLRNKMSLDTTGEVLQRLLQEDEKWR